MKTLPHFRSIAAMVALAGASLAISSCSSYSSPHMASVRSEQSEGIVFSYNDEANPRNRVCEEAGSLPVRAHRALTLWLANSELKSVSFAYPQYFVEMVDSETKKVSVWGLISDGRGNLVGVYIPKDGRPAWEIPMTAEIHIYVCQGSSRDALSRSIMTSLADAGYDEVRLNARRAGGLVDSDYLISKPALVAAPAAKAEEPKIAAPAKEEENAEAKTDEEADKDADADEEADKDADADQAEEEDLSDEF